MWCSCQNLPHYKNYYYLHILLCFVFIKCIVPILKGKLYKFFYYYCVLPPTRWVYRSLFFPSFSFNNWWKMSSNFLKIPQKLWSLDLSRSLMYGSIKIYDVWICQAVFFPFHHLYLPLRIQTISYMQLKWISSTPT